MRGAKMHSLFLLLLNYGKEKWKVSVLNKRSVVGL